MVRSLLVHLNCIVTVLKTLRSSPKCHGFLSEGHPRSEIIIVFVLFVPFKKGLNKRSGTEMYV